MRRRFPLWMACGLAVLAATVGAAPAEARVSEVSLRRLVTQAEAIVTGSVLRVVKVPAEVLDKVVGEPLPSVSLAELSVETWLKGAVQPERIWVFATSTWICDVTYLAKGDRVLLVLAGHGVADLLTPASAARIKVATGGAKVYRVAHSGRGLMRIHEYSGSLYAGSRAEDTWLPFGLDSIPGPDPRYSTFKRRVLLRDLTAFIRRATKSGHVGIRADVRRHLETLTAPYTAALDLARDALVELGQTGLPTLIKVLADPDSPWREAAAEAVLGLHEEDPGVLVALMTAEDVRKRRGAGYALALVVAHRSDLDDGLLPHVMRLLHDGDSEVRSWALHALLANSSTPAAMLSTVLMRAIRDPSPEVQWHLARGAGRLGSWVWEEKTLVAARASLELHLLALATHADVRLRRVAFEALAETGTVASARGVRRALTDPDPTVRAHAVRALARLGTAASALETAGLIASNDVLIRRAAAHAAGEIKSVAALDALIKALGDPDEATRGLAAWALGELGPKASRAAPRLKALLAADPDGLASPDYEDALRQILK